MYITKYNQLYPSFAHLFTSVLDSETQSNQVHFQPKVDIVEADSNYEIHASLPGLEKENFQIEIKNEILTLQGERKFEKESEGKTFKSVETKFGSFSRSFNLPENADKEHIGAEYVNGILKITIPKIAIHETKRTIPIK